MNSSSGSTMILQEPSGGVRTSSESVPVSQELPNSLTETSRSSEQETVSSPLTSRLPTIFPQYTCGVIRRTGDRASITMAFPYRLGVGCLMSLSILSNKVEYLAMKLFGVHIETEDGFRYVVFQKDGVRLLPRPYLAVQGACDETISMLLGPEVSYAISVSPVRKEEIKQAILATRCVTMEITSNSQDDCVLNLNLGQDEGYKIRKTLFE